ncbi:ATP-binding protein [Thermomonas sp.]|jgi:energy-coupling factor transporter ATP-binding protein EcfA2|uniref:ATP-dependent nuclease n=1 Tax=Thermomonas sp. TaxID=1971895 RepID=UPI00257FAC9E|nr:ATP-binding protein [Thermomonas sp.]
MGDHFQLVRFKNYKALKAFSIQLNEFKVLVGPNNAGKSTIIGAFRLLFEGIRKARSKGASYVPAAKTFGYQIPLDDIPIATENIFSDYDDSEPAVIEFDLASGSKLQLLFPENDLCYLIPFPSGKPVRSPSEFKRAFDITIGFVPVLGPVEHNEPLYQKEAARNALQTHRASRNFRNIWHHYPEGFQDFQRLIGETWPGMEILAPEIDTSRERPVLHMFCPEKRFPREIYWAGFGFQVWCQMLTYILRASGDTLLIIDEPDIYLHSDLQRQLVSILRDAAPDVLIATHSTEIISEAEPSELLVVRKGARQASRVKDVDQLRNIFATLGSNLNPVLTQLAKTRRAVFVEGKDFRLLSAFARKLGCHQVANRSDFAVIPAQGFNPGMVRNFKAGIESTVGKAISAAIIFDRDYRSAEEVESLCKEFSDFSAFQHIHQRKEIENYLLDSVVLQRTVDRRIRERGARTGAATCTFDVRTALAGVFDSMKSRVMSQHLPRGIDYLKAQNPSLDKSTLTQRVLEALERNWADPLKRIDLVPGKDVLAVLNSKLQEQCGFSITPASIVSDMRVDEVPADIRELIEGIDRFRKSAH